MSLYRKSVDSKRELQYGYEDGPRAGYFYRVVRKMSNEVIEGGDTRPEMCSEVEEQMNRSEIAEMLEKYGADEEHVSNVVMDLKI